MADDDRDARIRSRAYAIWEAEGRPVGRAAEHWSRALREIEASDPPPADVASPADELGDATADTVEAAQRDDMARARTLRGTAARRVATADAPSRPDCGDDAAGP
jgi:hypothetical protein